MANIRVRRSFGRSGAKRRQVEWSLAFQSTGNVSVPASSVVLLSTINPNSPSGIGTIVRSRGMFSINTDQGAASEEQTGAVGVAVINSVAAALGVTGVPGPATQISYDWLVYQSFTQGQFVSSNIGIRRSIDWLIDSKAMRKFGLDERLALVVENVHATDGFNILVNIRFLVKSG